jgi:alkylation response protein AidB-like acyl-CoA dehydrogenase
MTKPIDTGPDRILFVPGVERTEAALRSAPLSRVRSTFGGTTEIMKEIIGRSLGL